MFVYKITNKVNNKVYIGQTIRPIKQRFQRHMADALNGTLHTHFCNAIRKYGRDNFYIEILAKTDDQNILNSLEKQYIEKYNSSDSRFGYNESIADFKCGGDTYHSKSETEMAEIKEKIRNSKIGSKNPNSKVVKCFNVRTNQELYFDTVKACQEYFNQQNHRFITTRVLGEVRGLYKNEWKIAYADQDYGYFHEQYKRK